MNIYHQKCATPTRFIHTLRSLIQVGVLIVWGGGQKFSEKIISGGWGWGALGRKLLKSKKNVMSRFFGSRDFFAVL